MPQSKLAIELGQEARPGVPSPYSALHEALGVFLNDWGAPRSERLRKLLCPWGHGGKVLPEGRGLKPGLGPGKRTQLAQPVCILIWALSWSSKSADSIDLS